MEKQPILWKCDKCNAFQVLKQGDDTDPRHKDCGGNWRVTLMRKAEVVDFSVAT